MIRSRCARVSARPSSIPETRSPIRFAVRTGSSERGRRHKASNRAGALSPTETMLRLCKVPEIKRAREAGENSDHNCYRHARKEDPFTADPDAVINTAVFAAIDLFLLK